MLARVRAALPALIWLRLVRCGTGGAAELCAVTWHGLTTDLSNISGWRWIHGRWHQRCAQHCTPLTCASRYKMPRTSRSPQRAIVLLEQDLGVLTEGVREGPLLPKQILLTNLLTDVPELTIGTDRALDRAAPSLERPRSLLTARAGVIGITLALPFTPMAAVLGFAAVPSAIVAAMVAIVFAYIVSAEFARALVLSTRKPLMTSFSERTTVVRSTVTTRSRDHGDSPGHSRGVSLHVHGCARLGVSHCLSPNSGRVPEFGWHARAPFELRHLSALCRRRVIAIGGPAAASAPVGRSRLRHRSRTHVRRVRLVATFGRQLLATGELRRSCRHRRPTRVGNGRPEDVAVPATPLGDGRGAGRSRHRVWLPARRFAAVPRPLAASDTNHRAVAASAAINSMEPEPDIRSCVRSQAVP